VAESVTEVPEHKVGCDAVATIVGLGFTVIDALANDDPQAFVPVTV
jgi:hypothetical protein